MRKQYLMNLNLAHTTNDEDRGDDVDDKDNEVAVENVEEVAVENVEEEDSEKKKIYCNKYISRR